MAPGCRGGRPHPHVVPATSTTSADGGNRTGHGVPHTLGPKVDHINLAYHTSIHQSEQHTSVLLKEHTGLKWRSGVPDTTDCGTTKPKTPVLGLDTWSLGKLVNFLDAIRINML